MALDTGWRMAHVCAARDAYLTGQQLARVDTVTVPFEEGCCRQLALVRNVAGLQVIRSRVGHARYEIAIACRVQWTWAI